jgi:predicted enzyme related to lactoylglutathione lyase
MMFNLEVDDIEKEVKRLKKAKVKVIADTYHVPDYGLIATFQDPDGNYFQFVQVRASK